MRASGLQPASQNTKGNTTEETDVDSLSIQSTESTRAPTPRLAHDKFQSQHSAAHWDFNKQQAALDALQAELDTKIESLERNLFYHSDHHQLVCNANIAQFQRTVTQDLRRLAERLDALETKHRNENEFAQDLRSLTESLDVLETKQLNENHSDPILQRIDMLAGRLELTNHKIKEISNALPADGGIALADCWARCSPDLGVLSRKVDLMESTLEVIKAKQDEMGVDLAKGPNQFHTLTSRLDRIDASLLDAFNCAGAAANKLRDEATLKEQLLQFGSRLEIVDSKLSVVLSCSEIPGDIESGDKSPNWRERFVNPSSDQMTNDFAAKLCGVSERLGRIEEQFSQDLRACKNKLETGTQCYLLQLMINHFVEALTEDSQRLAFLQWHFAAQLAEREKCASIGVIEI